MVSEPTNDFNQSSTSYYFVTPIKLDQDNFIVWSTQVPTSIKGNGLEGFINSESKCPIQYLVQASNVASSSINGLGTRVDNPTFFAWIITY